MNSVADQIASTAIRLNGSATKGLPNEHDVSVLVELTSNREPEFRASIATITGGAPGVIHTNETGSSPTEKKSFMVHIVEPSRP